jgi:hypothetical protein
LLPEDRHEDWAVAGREELYADWLALVEELVRSRLRKIQRRPDLINALLGQTGLTLQPPPP